MAKVMAMEAKSLHMQVNKHAIATQLQHITGAGFFLSFLMPCLKARTHRFVVNE
jgi:hypothetical protein